MSIMHRGIETFGKQPIHSQRMVGHPTSVTNPLPTTHFIYQQKYVTGPYQYLLLFHMFSPIVSYNTPILPTTNTFQGVND